MKATEQTLQQTRRAIKKIIDKFPSSEEATQLTDIHLRVSQDYTRGIPIELTVSS